MDRLDLYLDFGGFAEATSLHIALINAALEYKPTVLIYNEPIDYFV